MRTKILSVFFTILALGLSSCGIDPEGNTQVVVKNTVTMDTQGLPNSFSIKLVAENIGAGTFEYATLAIHQPSGTSTTVYGVTLSNTGTVTTTCTLQIQSAIGNEFNCVPQSTTPPSVGALPQTVILPRGVTYQVKMHEAYPATDSLIGSFTIN